MPLVIDTPLRASVVARSRFDRAAARRRQSSTDYRGTFQRHQRVRARRQDGAAARLRKLRPIEIERSTAGRFQKAFIGGTARIGI